MRCLLVPASVLVTLALGCGAAERDPEAATKAAKAAGSALEPLALEPHKGDKGVELPGEGKLPRGPGGLVDPNPASGTATCVVDDGDSDTPDGGGHGQKKPPVKPKIPIDQRPLDGAPTVEGAMPKPSSSPPPAPTPAPPPTASATGTSSPTVTDAKLVSRYTTQCETQMAGRCTELCRDEDMTWVGTNAEGTGGTCFTTSLTTSASGARVTSVECGCLCE